MKIIAYHANINTLYFLSKIKAGQYVYFVILLTANNVVVSTYVNNVKQIFMWEKINVN